MQLLGGRQTRRCIRYWVGVLLPSAPATALQAVQEAVNVLYFENPGRVDCEVGHESIITFLS